MELDFDIANFGELELARRDSKARLRKREAVVSRARTEAREAWFIAGFYPAKECVKRFIESPQDILQYLRVNHAKLRANALDVRQLVLLVFVRHRLSSDAPCVSALLETGIIQLTAQSEPTPERGLLSGAWIDSILVCS